MARHKSIVTKISEFFGGKTKQARKKSTTAKKASSASKKRASASKKRTSKKAK